MGSRIADNSRRLDPVQRRLDVKDRSVAATLFFAVGRLVFDDPDRVIGNILPFIVLSGSSGGSSSVADRRNGCRCPDRCRSCGRIAEIAEFKVGILPGVDNDNEPASPPHHFVEPEVLEMPAVGEIDVRPVVGGQAKGFLDQRLDGDCGPSVL